MPTTIVDSVYKPVNVLQNAAVSSDDSAAYGGLSTADANIILTVTDPPTGDPSPLFQVIATQIDPADGASLTSGEQISLTGPGTITLQAKPSISGSLLIVWHVVGSWTGVNVTIIPNAKRIAGEPQPVTVAQLPALLGQGSRSGSLSVVLAGDQTVVPVSLEMANSAVTSNQGNPAVLNNAWPTKLTDGTHIALVTPGNALRVDGSLVVQPVSDNGGSLSVDDNGGSLSVDDGGASLTVDDGGGSLTVDSGQLPPSLGQHASSQSVSVVVSGDQSVIPVSLELANTGITAHQGNPAVLNNAWLMKLTDGTNIALVTPGNALRVDGSLVTQPVVTLTNPTFYAVFDRIAPAANKYMAVLWNGTVSRKLVIQRVWVYNWQNSSVTGVLLEQQMIKISARTAGTPVTPLAGDPSDTLTSGIIAETAATGVTDAGMYKRIFCASEEEALSSAQATPGTTESTGLQYSRVSGTRGLVVRQSQGWAIKNLTNNTNGSVSYVVEFTDEAA
jgi:hypothetical protein